MIFKKKSEEPEPEPEYTFEVLPGEIPDGVHDFEGVQVAFSKPGWTWVILEDGHLHKWDKQGFSTRDAALVDLLRAAKDVKRVEQGV